ncbi:MAG: trypsin-like peptidase domain-containing protein [Propionivibrio sp.]|nr:trypsin-like peptidase domain-containing protein [Propionivibrio sp.]
MLLLGSISSRWSAHLFVLFALLPFARVATAALPDLIEQIKPSIVVIGTYSRTRNPAFVMRGTGFVVGNGTLVATNAHVVPEVLDAASGETLLVQAVSGTTGTQRRLAKTAAKDKSHDLALLRIEGTPLPAMTLHSVGPVREGQSVAFTGFPIGGVLGLSPVTHRGIISAITPIALPSATANQLNEQVIKRLKSGTFEVYQLDGTAYPGNSGGPLFEMERGEVIGIINMVFVKGTKESVLSQPSGISFAVPVQYLQELLRNLQ